MSNDLSFLRLLIVDDEPAITRLLTMLLADANVTQVTAAKSGKEARNFLEFRRNEFDIVICDWNMPDLTGLDLLKWVRTQEPKLPFIMVTSRGDLDSVKSAARHGVSDYLLKPFKREQLHSKLHQQARTLIAASGRNKVFVWPT